MRVGTKSVLFGAHQFLTHPWFVALAWWKIYGFPWDPRLWVAFFVHDLGYVGCPNMDGEEGEDHIWLGAEICGWLFDADYPLAGIVARRLGGVCDRIWGHQPQGDSWFRLCFYHSRFRAMRYGRKPSRLCIADKLAMALEPWWLYLPRAIASGEIEEYMALAKKRRAAGEPKYASMNLHTNARRRWFADVQSYLRRWVDEHKDDRDDTWTPKADLIGTRVAKTDSGVWQ